MSCDIGEVQIALVVFTMQISLRPACRSALCQPVAQSSAFWQNRRKIIHLHQQKEEERRLFLFSRFRGKLSYMNGKIILYDRENYKQARKNLLLYNFHEVL